MKTCWRSVLGLIVVLGCEPAEKNQEKELVLPSLQQTMRPWFGWKGEPFKWGRIKGIRMRCLVNSQDTS